VLIDVPARDIPITLNSTVTIAIIDSHEDFIIDNNGQLVVTGPAIFRGDLTLNGLIRFEGEDASLTILGSFFRDTSNMVTAIDGAVLDFASETAFDGTSFTIQLTGPHPRVPPRNARLRRGRRPATGVTG